jgi:hypothetical protein
LAERIRERIQQIDSRLEGVQVAASIGVAGGKRGAPRPEAHPSATLDDLINMASRASTQAKAEVAKIVAARGVSDPGHEIPDRFMGVGDPPSEEPGPRVVVDAYSMKSTGDGVEVTVGLRRGARLEQAAIAYSGADLLEAFGIAAAAVLSRFLPDEHRFTLEEMRLLPDPDGAGIVAVTLRLETPRGGERLVGAVSLLEDRYRSAVNAVLDATNRRLGYLADEALFVAPKPEDEPHHLEQDRSAALHPPSGHAGGAGG